MWLVAVVLCLGLVKMDTYAASSTLKITGQSEPSNVTLGKSFDCKGVITSNYKLTNVTGKITTSSGTVKYQKSLNPSYSKAVYKYSLLGNAIDCSLLFNKLPVGSYKYVITAKDSSGTSKTLVNKSFNVVGNASTLKISGASALTSLKLGKSWTCNGTISSNYKITEVYGAILKSDGVTQVYKKTVKPNAKSYKLAGGAIDCALLFNKLPVGTYYYVVDATDASGKKLNVVKNKFTVQGDTSTLKISGNKALTSLKPGKSWTCNGTISSNYKITEVYGAILKSDGVTPVYKKTVKPNATSFKLANSGIDKALLFNKLPVGTYYYVVDATDASGKKLNVVKNKFTVQKDASTLKISGNSALTSLVKGNAWTCNGTITSNYKITQVYGAILKSDGVTQVYKKTVKPNATSFKLANSGIDKALLFNKLPEGTYYYVVDATDASGKKLNVVKNKFTVEKSAKKIYSNPVPSATTIGEREGSFKYKFEDGSMHRGVDFSAKEGAPIYALAAGKIVELGYDSSYGNFMVIQHTDGSGMYSLYAHMKNGSINLKKNSMVTKGKKIGEVGNTGETSKNPVTGKGGYHLHLELATGKVKNKYLSNENLTYLVNPLDYINL